MRFGGSHQVFDAARAIEQTVMRMIVKMYEISHDEGGRFDYDVDAKSNLRRKQVKQSDWGLRDCQTRSFVLPTSDFAAKPPTK
jgi:hypothetical protein